ncbi:penicillin-binding protein 2 [Thermophilibacter sp.]|uniref:penicillin-binding protein 2 n=1 Tax=Thermophilibacter sp. TaxID=2847309 RepID=UPI003A945F16
MDLSLILIIVCVVLAAALVVVFVVFGRAEANFTFDIGGAAPRASGGSDSSAEKKSSSRLIGLAVAVGGVFSVLLARLWSMQLVSSEDYAKQAESNRRSVIYTQAPRGRILDRKGREIVGNRASLTVVAEGDVVDDTVEVQLLANLIGMPAQAVRRKLQDTTEGFQSPRTISVDVSRRVVAFIGEHPEAFPGVTVQQRTQRSYPYGSLAAHVVGYVSTVTEEQLEASKEAKDGSVSYRSGDVVGQSGVELSYESVLAGTRGEQTVFVDAGGNVLDYSTTIEPESGSDVELTIDVDVQRVAEESLERVVSSQSCVGGSVVALDCTSGEVLAMASYPTFSPNVFTGGISQADWDALSAEDAHYPLMNRAIGGQYPAGSVIKPLTTFAALEHGVATGDSSWYCSGWWSWSGSRDDGTIMKCWEESGHGGVNLISGITYSCDVVFYEIGKGFYYSDDPEGMQETFRAYGLGSVSGIDLSGEAAGRVPDPEWKREYFKSLGYSDEDSSWKGGDNCNIAIGQGDILVTCLQMADAYCSIANRGPAWKPHVLRGVRSKVGDGFVSEYRPEKIVDVEESQQDREIVERGMWGVIYEEAPTQTEHWTNMSVSVAGKTGTGEQTASHSNACWFGCYAPSDDPKYVVFANVDGGDWGSTTAMLVARDTLGAIYGEPDTVTSVVATGD